MPRPRKNVPEIDEAPKARIAEREAAAGDRTAKMRASSVAANDEVLQSQHTGAPSEASGVEARLAMLEEQLKQQQSQNQLLLNALLQNGGISGPQEKEIVNNGWRVMFNPSHENPDNRDWHPGTPKKWDADQGYKQGYTTMHIGDGKWEWGYEHPETGQVIWSGKLVGEKPNGPPKEPPVSLDELRRLEVQVER